MGKFYGFKKAFELTFKAYMKSDKNIFKEGNTIKDYYELFMEFYKFYNKE